MSNPSNAEQALALLRSAGINIAIDDFGTGYGSLTYLQQFPITELKIDRSFTAQLTNHTRSASIVSACVDLAHNLGLIALAEGVETTDAHDALTRLGCDYAQGYLYNKPLPPEAIDNLITVQPTVSEQSDSRRGVVSGCRSDAMR